MKKNFTILMLLALCCLGMNAGTVTDVITGDKLLEKYKGQGSTVSDPYFYRFSDMQFESEAKYDINCAVLTDQNKDIQLNCYDSTRGLVATKAGGIPKKITVIWGSGNTAGRCVDLYYNENTAFESVSDLAGNYDIWVGNAIMFGSEDNSYTIPKGYEYIALGAAWDDIFIKEIRIDWWVEGETVAAPAFSIPTGQQVEKGTKLTLTCEEGAEIYYTIDGSNPTTASIHYTGDPIEINEDVTIKAIACKNDIVSPVATANYTVVPSIMDLTELAGLGAGSKFQMGIDLTVVYHNGSYNYVYDGKTYSLIYDLYVSFDQGDVIEAGWAGLKKISLVGRPYMDPDGTPVVKTKGAPVPAPTEVTDAYVVNNVNNVNQYYRLKNVYINDTQAYYASWDKPYTGKMGAEEINLLSKTFGAVPEAEGTYDVTGFVSINTKTVYNDWGNGYEINYAQFLPIEFEQLFAEVPVGAAGISTFCSEYDLDFSGQSDVTAFVANLTDANTVTLTSVEKVPAGVGVIVKADPSTNYKVKVIEMTKDEKEQYTVANDLIGVTEATDVTYGDAKSTNYILLRDTNENTVAFYPLEEGYTHPLPAGKAYLHIQMTRSNAPARIVFDDEEVTGIEAVNCEEVESGNVYNLQGIKVDSNYKGFVIKNGKKFYNR